MNTGLYNALKKLRNHIPRLTDMLTPGMEEEIGIWNDIIDAKLLSRLAPDFPLVASICGGGSSGKSTLFNSLSGEHLSLTGGKAGLNRRVLFAVPERRVADTDLLADLARPFKEVPGRLTDAEQLTVPGKPLFVPSQSVLSNMVILDTPDFDTGAKGSYTNREITRMALEASDILIYIFTNSNYNNRDNTDFIAKMLTGIGKRKCYLVYRVYPSFTEQEVMDHAMTVAHAIYGKLADQYLLGVYRTDEDNRIASGERLMEIKPADDNEPDLLRALHSLNVPEIRRELFSSILKDVSQRVENIRDHSEVALDELRLYSEALEIAQNKAVREALRNFPINRIMRRFARVWADTDPVHVRIMRKTGGVIELPLKMLLGAASWARDQMTAEPADTGSTVAYAQKVDEDLVNAVTGIYSQTVGPQLTVNISSSDPHARKMTEVVEFIRIRNELPAGKNPRVESSGDNSQLSITVETPPVIRPDQDLLRSKDFETVLDSILAEKETILGISQTMEADLKQLAGDFRERMGLWRKVSQTFWAFLNVLPATVAVTYVLSTGDPVGGAGIKVKLAGLFGVKDLYALFAIPFTTGLKKADRQQIEEMLRVILQTWLKDKSQIVQQLFEKNITGGPLRHARRNIAEAGQLLNDVNAMLQYFPGQQNRFAGITRTESSAGA